MTRIKNGLIETAIRVIRLIRGFFRFSVTLIGVIRDPVLAFAFLKIFAAHKEIDG